MCHYLFMLFCVAFCSRYFVLSFVFVSLFVYVVSRTGHGRAFMCGPGFFGTVSPFAVTLVLLFVVFLFFSFLSRCLLWCHLVCYRTTSIADWHFSVFRACLLFSWTMFCDV